MKLFLGLLLIACGSLFVILAVLKHEHIHYHNGLRQWQELDLQKPQGVWRQETIKCDCGDIVIKEPVFSEGATLGWGKVKVYGGRKE